MSSPDTCTCEGRGWIYEKSGNNISVRPCICTLKHQKVKAVGNRYAEASLVVEPRPAQAKAMEQVKAKPCAGYFFYGTYGSGKTWLMAAQFDHVCVRGRNWEHVAWISDPDLADMSRNPDDLRLDRLIIDLQQTAKLWHVFIDDLGKSRMSDWVRQDLYRLVNAIYVNEHRLSLTSNYSLDQLARESDPLMPGGAIMRRVDDMVIKCKI